LSVSLLGNTSTKTPEELDDSVNLEAEEPQVWAEDMIDLRNELAIKILGGCCGTNHHHIQSLVAKLKNNDVEIRKAVVADNEVLT